MDRSLAFLDPLLARAALVVEGDDTLGGTAHVGDDEADARNKLARMPLDFGNHPARLGPACRLVGEIGVVPPDLARRSSRTVPSGSVKPHGPEPPCRRQSSASPDRGVGA